MLLAHQYYGRNPLHGTPMTHLTETSRYQRMESGTEFKARLRDVVGLSPHAPDEAIVLSIDETEARSGR